MKKNIKTSPKRLALKAAALSFVLMFFLLLIINITYFFMWYQNQKDESLYDMNKSYQSYGDDMDISHKESFLQYILQKDTLIIPNDGSEIICSSGVEKKIHEHIDRVQNKLFYKSDGKIFFIFSREYDGIGQVKVFFDTTPYVHSQLIIVSISLLFMLLFSGFVYFSSLYVLQRLEKKNENLRQFITDVSHELKTPLHIINTKIDVFRMKCEKGLCKVTDYDDMLDLVKGNTGKMNKILETFLTLARLENASEKLLKREVCLRKKIQEISENIAEIYPQKNISFAYEIPQDLCLEVEETSFTMLIENLLTNAIKFSGEEVLITLTADEKGFFVSDKGQGISEKNLKNIWEKFYRENYSREGFGVGLFIVKRICELHHWSVSVESVEGEGSTFGVRY